MTRIAVIHHLQQPFLGNAAAPLGAVEEHFRGALPSLDGLDGLVSFGGEQDAWDPALAPEVELIAEAVAREIPFLGVCLGAQLLARATGGENLRLRAAVGDLAPADRDRGGSRPGRDPARAPTRCIGTRTASSRRLAPSRSTHGRTAAARRASASAAARGASSSPESAAAGRASDLALPGDRREAPGLDGWYAGWPYAVAEAGTTAEDARAADALHLPARRRSRPRSSGPSRGWCGPRT